MKSIAFALAALAMTLTSLGTMATAGGYQSVLETMANNDAFVGSANNGAVNETAAISGGQIVERVDTNPTYAAVKLKAASKTGNVGLDRNQLTSEDLVDAERQAAARNGLLGYKGEVDTKGQNFTDVVAQGAQSIVGGMSSIKEEAEITAIDTPWGGGVSLEAQAVSRSLAGAVASGKDVSTASVKQNSSLNMETKVGRTFGGLNN